jgi:hypothetical protein
MQREYPCCSRDGDAATENCCVPTNNGLQHDATTRRRIGSAVTPITASGWSCRRRAIKPYRITGGKPLTREPIQSQPGCARATRIPLRRCPNSGCRCWHPRRLALVAREHNEHNVDSASPVSEHFSNEPLFDSRDEAAAERLDILNASSTARSPARGHQGQGRPRVKRALMLAR